MIVRVTTAMVARMPIPLRRPLVAALFLVGAAAGAGASDPGDPVVFVDVGARRLSAISCAQGRPLGALPLPEAGGPGPGLWLDPERTQVVVVGSTSLFTVDATRFAVRRSTRLPIEARHAALGTGPDGVIVVAGPTLGSGEPASWRMIALDRDDLTIAHEWTLPSALSALRAETSRSRFLVTFAALPLAWEVDWSRAAEPVLKGLVHDYRGGEAVPLPGRFTPREIPLPAPARRVIPGAAGVEVVHVDATGRGTILNLNVRRVTEPIDLVGARWTLPYGDLTSRGWLSITADGRVWRIEAPSGRRQDLEPLGAPTLAAMSIGSQALVALRDEPSGGAILRLSGPGLGQRQRMPMPVGTAVPPLEWFPSMSGRCAALIDAAGRWLTGVTMPGLAKGQRQDSPR